MIIGGVATILTLIFSILALTGGKNKNALYWGIGFVFSISILIISIVYLVERIQQKVGSGVDWVVKHEEGISINNDDDRKTERQKWIDTLKSYVNDTYIDQLPPEFYENKVANQSTDGNIGLPFIYPYAIKYNFLKKTGQLRVVTSDSTFLNNISRIAFDRNFIIAHIDNSNSTEVIEPEHTKNEYILFDMRTREYLNFANQDQLIDKSKKIGYNGSSQMHYLSDDYSAWIDALVND